MSLRRRFLPLVLAPILTGAWLTSPAAATTAGPCPNQQAIHVPGAAWVTAGARPPATQIVRRPASGGLANTCPQRAR